MKNKFKTAFTLPVLVGVLTGCSLEAKPDSTALMTALNYAEHTRITYHENDEYYTPNGKKISIGDYKPVWNAIQDRLGISLLEHQAAANSGEKKSVSYFRDNWLLGPYADVTMGTVAAITNYSVSGNKETILDLRPYLKKSLDEQGNPYPQSPEHPLPNIAKFLHDNPGVVASILTAKHSHPEKGALYFVPYFDGFSDTERMTLIRADYVERLLDDTAGYFSDDTKILGKEGEAKYSQHYEPFYLKEEGSILAPEYKVQVPNVDPITGEDKPGNPTIEVKKNETENIIYLQNGLINKGDANSINLIAQFKNYIKYRYGENSLYYQKPSELFLGYQACYDVDELVALMRIVKVSAKSIFGKDSVKEMVPMLPRAMDNQRSSDLYRWAGQLFGVRGLDSRNGYLYLNGTVKYEGSDEEYHKVHDCRGDASMLNLIKKMRELYQEGLILQDFDNKAATGTTDGTFADDVLVGGGNKSYAGLMHFDLVQEQGELNYKKESEEFVTPEPKGAGHPYSLRPMINAVTHWDTNDEGGPDTWMQFTESWAFVKTSAVCLNAALVNTPEKLYAAFRFLDYIYSSDGKFLYNFGPYEDGYMYEFHADDPDPKEGTYIEYRGKKIPKFTPKTLEQHRKYDSYLRRYVGATIPMGYEKLKGMEYQITHANAREGIDRINKALEKGSYKHVLTGPTTGGPDDPYNTAFYHIVPSSFLLTKGQSSNIAELLNKNKLGSMFTDSSSSNFNIWDSYIMNLKSQIAPPIDKYLETVNGDWQLPKLVAYYQDAYEIMS